MRDLLPEIERWRRGGRRVALATVVKAWGSAPRPLGAKMAVSSAGDVAGSVSGGCVEGAVIEEAREVLDSGDPRLLRFGVTDERAWEVGLSCGGEIEVFVERLPETGSAVADTGGPAATERTAAGSAATRPGATKPDATRSDATRLDATRAEAG